MKTIRFLQVAIAQREWNTKLGGFYHCSIGIDVETNELTRLYPIAPSTMWKHKIYDIQAELMTCRRERSYKPVRTRFVAEQTQNDTNAMLNKIPLTTVDHLNEDKLSMGVVDVSQKRLSVSTNMQEVYQTQTSLFCGDECTTTTIIRSHADSVHKDIRIQFEDKQTCQGYRNLSYNESHFYVGLERNGSLPNTYISPSWDRLIIGNMRNHRSTFIGLCLFKSKNQNQSGSPYFV